MIHVAEILGGQHKLSHSSRPLQDLWTNILHEGSGAPSAKNHDLGDGAIGKKQGHGGPRTNGVGANVHVVVTECGLAAAAQTTGSEQVVNVFLSDETWFLVGLLGVKPTIHRCCGWCIGAVVENATEYSAPKENWVEDGVGGTALGASLGFVVVLLLHKCDGDEASKFVELGVIGRDCNVFVFGGEDEISYG